MNVPISQRARRYGYLIWPKAMDTAVRAVLKDAQTIETAFNGAELGSKRIDWAHRRISLGPAQTRVLPDTTQTFVLDVQHGKLIVVTK